MNKIINWRYWVIHILLGLGIILLLAIAGEDERSLGAWLETRLYLSIGSAACFYTMNRLRLHWESEGKIPRLLNKKYY